MRNIVLDSQVLNAVSSCPYRYNLGFERQLESISKSSLLESGDLLHTIFKVFYTLAIRRPDLPYSRRVELALKYGAAHAKTLQQVEDKSEEIIFHADAYFEHYEGEFWTPLFVEKSFAVTLYESEEEDLRIIYEGIVDLIVDSQYGQIGVDHKKSSRRLDYAGLLLANQFKGYTASLGFSGNRFVINEVGVQKSLKPNERFIRHTLEYSNGVLAEWRTNTIYWGQQLAFYLENNTFPQNFTSCKHTADGQYPIGCSYQSACNTEPGEAREFYLAQFFKERPKRWSPHDRDEEFDQRLEELIKVA